MESGLNRISATCWKDQNPTYPAEFKMELPAPIRNAVKIYINDFKLTYTAAPGTIPQFVRLKFLLDGNLIQANDAVISDEFMIFPRWDPVTLSLSENYAYPGQLIWQSPGRQTPFNGVHCQVLDEYRNPIVYKNIGIKFAADFYGIPNTHGATSQALPNTPVTLWNGGTPF